jgi:hypothetical protein
MFQQLNNVKDLNVFNALSNHGLVHNGFTWKK